MQNKKIVQTLKLTHTDDCKNGPRMYVEEVDCDYEIPDDDGDIYVDDFKVSVNFDVYKISLDYGEVEADLIKSFQTKDEAILFFKQQYFLYTGNKKDQIEIPEDMKSQLGEESYDGGPEYIMILSQNHVEAHSLHKFAKW